MNVKNSIKVLLAVLLVMFVMTGCGMREYIGIVVDNNKDVNLEVVMAMDDEAIDTFLSMSSSGEEITDEARWAYVDGNSDETYDDYTKTKYTTDGFKGYTYSKKLGPIEDYVGKEDEVMVDDISNGGKIFTKNGNNYVLKIDLGNSGDSDMETYKQYKESGADMDFKIYVKLPVAATKNNATKVSDDKLTYEWDMFEAKTVEIEFNLDGASNNMLPIIIGVVCAVVVIAAIAFVATRKKGE